MSIKALIADDQPQISEVLRLYSQKEGYETRVAKDGQEALALFDSFKPDVVLLDVMMPKVDGFEVCRRIRAQGDTPVIMITARGEDFEKIMGLDIGADDYIVKPFSPEEVMARVRAVLRRLNRDGQPDSAIRLGSLSVNLTLYEASVSGEPLALTKKEMELLYTFVQSPNRVFSREKLLSDLWGYDYLGDVRTVDSHVKRLRAKLDAHPHPDWAIATVWGVGYKLEVLHES
jgi:DNA-binding response OmpR family regulator